MVVPYKFIYFQVRGKAQQIRYMLEDNKIDYEDSHVTFDQWKEVKPKMKFGQLPCLLDGDFELPQSGAIARYIARQNKLYGEGDKQAALIDMIHDAMVDLRDKTLRLVFSPEEGYDDRKKEYADNLPGELRKFESILKENENGKGFFVGQKISLADYCVYDLLVNQSVFVAGCLDGVPALKDFVDRMHNRPNIAKYRETDHFKKIPITPKDRLK